MKWLLTALVVVVYLLHHDYWNWHDKSLVFGFLPVGLAYHAFFCVLASITLAILVKFAWPSHLEREVEEAGVADVPVEGHGA